MGNSSSTFYLRKNPAEVLRELLDIECLNMLQFNDLYFAIHSFYKIYPQDSNVGSGTIVDPSNPPKQNEVEIKQCLKCKRIVVKEIEPKLLNNVRKMVKDILNGEGGNTIVKNEIVPIGDTFDCVTDSDAAGGSISTSVVSDGAMGTHQNVDMKGFITFFRAFIHRYRLIPDVVAVKWALEEFHKLSDLQKMEYNQMKICICHIKRRIEHTRSINNYKIIKQEQNCKAKSVAKIAGTRNADYKVVARSLFTLRNEYTKTSQTLRLKENCCTELQAATTNKLTHTSN